MMYTPGFIQGGKNYRERERERESSKKPIESGETKGTGERGERN